MGCQGDLLHVVGALRAAGRFAGRLDGGQQKRDEYGNDFDHHEQFDQSEAAPVTPPFENLSHNIFLSLR